MAITQKPAMFETTDGEEFETQEAAEKHESKITAHQEFKAAWKRFAAAFAAEMTLADGVEFNPDGYPTLWAVRITAYGLPHLCRVNWVWYQDIIVDDGRVFLLEQPSDRSDRVIRWELSTLFSTEKSARHELIRRMREKLVSIQREIDQLIETWGAPAKREGDEQ